MNMLTMTLLMLLSTASARTLKADNPNHQYTSCTYLAVCVPDELVGNKTLAIKVLNINHGQDTGYIGDAESGYCAVFTQTGYGPEVDLEFDRDGVLVHKGHYQQNFCGFMAGAIHTDDPNAEIREGSASDHWPGIITIKAW